MKDKIKDHKNFDKKKEIKIKWAKLKFIIILIKNKNKKLDMRDKIENHKNFDKKTKEKKESKVKGLN